MSEFIKEYREVLFGVSIFVALSACAIGAVNSCEGAERKALASQCRSYEFYRHVKGETSYIYAGKTMIPIEKGGREVCVNRETGQVRVIETGGKR